MSAEVVFAIIGGAGFGVFLAAVGLVTFRSTGTAGTRPTADGDLDRPAGSGRSISA